MPNVFTIENQEIGQHFWQNFWQSYKPNKNFWTHWVAPLFYQQFLIAKKNSLCLNGCWPLRKIRHCLGKNQIKRSRQPLILSIYWVFTEYLNFYWLVGNFEVSWCWVLLNQICLRCCMLSSVAFWPGFALISKCLRGKGLMTKALACCTVGKGSIPAVGYSEGVFNLWGVGAWKGLRHIEMVLTCVLAILGRTWT